MSSIRQNKVEALLQRELSLLFQQKSTQYCLGSMVSVTVVRVSADMSFAKCYLSVFLNKDKEVVLNKIRLDTKKIKKDLGVAMRSLRKMPDLVFFLDDSSDYAENIEKLLKK